MLDSATFSNEGAKNDDRTLLAGAPENVLDF
eukprot:SAG22_NODE_16158_length_331_cov_1.616379_1_plen_30_part_10